MRLPLVLAALAVGLGLGAAGLALLGDDPPEELLPDLDQAVPAGLSVVRDGRSQRLTFLSAVDNDGPGPLLVEGSRASPRAPSMTVRQLIRRTDGGTRSVQVRATMRYVEAETHAHWHLLAFERYELRTADGAELVAPDEKTGFCLGDRYDASRKVRAENEPEQAVWTEECGRGEPELLHVAEGISPGYGDDYVPKLEGQYVDVTDVPAGRYLLVHRVNPERTLRETNYRNNAASVLLELRRPKRGPPEVEVLARCPESDRCR
jgi:Lysyl oxidase